MSHDVVAIVRDMPDVRAVLDDMIAGGDLLVDRAGEDSPAQLFDGDGRLLVSIEIPVRIGVPGEVERLLGIEHETIPVWWVEARATLGVGADRIADDFAERLVHRFGGTVWTDDADDDTTVA